MHDPSLSRSDELEIPASTPVVSIIVPTICEMIRRELLERAIESVLSQKGVTLELIVVVNGNRFDTSLLSRLQHDTKIRVIQLSDGNVSHARLSGIRAARGEFFCFLDDDDEFLEDALRTRVERMHLMSDADVVVTNGFILESDERPLVTDALAQKIRENLPLSFQETNWFSSPASTFRKSRIEAPFFDFPFKHFEWTFLFYKLISTGKNIDYLHALTYRKFESNPLSISKTDAYLLSYPDILLDILALPLSDPLRAGLKRKLPASLNAVSQLHLRQNRIRQAWLTHLKCLAHGGWRFLPYTRALVFALIDRRPSPSASRSDDQ